MVGFEKEDCSAGGMENTTRKSTQRGVRLKMQEEELTVEKMRAIKEEVFFLLRKRTTNGFRNLDSTQSKSKMRFLSGTPKK